jgi:enoyl-CoA hydratase/carnithine racemase
MTLMTEDPVLLSSDANGVRTLTLNRPHRKNAINAELWAALRDARTAARNDQDARAVVADLGVRLVAGPSVALAQTKALLHEGVDRTMRDALASEARAQAVNFAGTDVPEAFAAFAEKRTPLFTGRWAVPGTGSAKE